MTVGILGMAFKGESDDIRSSLSYKLKRMLRCKAAGVLTPIRTSPSTPTSRPLEEVLDAVGPDRHRRPTRVYADLRVDQPVVDIWNLRGGGVVV